ncbi:MarR family winged helix-turn-helix transcriptional regulator [Altererythrobacter sp. MTPC7]|uniref:MarR family winged helix-turn-helix transcriptional regulator n=1 Tax=Altererythrobacter sp. MTPC7 TaxID=3056567 RepID=UPI0036F2DACC
MSGTGNPSSESGTSTLADFLPYRLSVASNAVSARIADLYRSRFGLTIGEWRIMAMLGEGEPLTQRELVTATLMDKVAVNRACKVLEKRELVSRTPHPDDGRSHRLALTGAGEGIYNEVMPLAREIERQLLAGFTEEEYETMRGLLARLRQQAEHIGSG